MPAPRLGFPKSSRNVRVLRGVLLAAGLLAGLAGPGRGARAADEAVPPGHPAGAKRWLWSTAHEVPKHTTTEGSGYFSLVTGRDAKLYVGTAKYGFNAFLVQFDPKTKSMKVVLDAQKEIGTSPTGFAAQAKFHTRNNVGESGKIYLGTKQGYPKDGETRDLYPGGHPMVYDPATGKTRVYGIPVPQQGIISVTPDETRNVAYVSTCSDERPIESTHFLILDLETGRYRDLLDCRHMYAFIVLDHLRRAYHPKLGGDIVRWDPRTEKLETLKQTIDGKPPTPESHLADEHAHPINWDVSPDARTMYAVAMSTNRLYAYDLTATGDVLPGRSLGPLLEWAKNTDCRALCAGPTGTVWAGVGGAAEKGDRWLHLVRWRPGDAKPQDLGPIGVRNGDFTTFAGPDGKQLPWHHGFRRLEDGTLRPLYVIMAIAEGPEQTVYVTTLAPFTLHAIPVGK